MTCSMMMTNAGYRWDWCLKGYLHRGRNTRRPPAWLPPAGSTVDRFVEIMWCCLHHHGPAEPPQWAHSRARRDHSWSDSSARPTGKNMEHWLVSIYISMTKCRKMGPLQMMKLRADPWHCKHSTRVENAPAPTGGPAPHWCKCNISVANALELLQSCIKPLRLLTNEGHYYELTEDTLHRQAVKCLLWVFWRKKIITSEKVYEKIFYLSAAYT